MTKKMRFSDPLGDILPSNFAFGREGLRWLKTTPAPSVDIQDNPFSVPSFSMFHPRIFHNFFATKYSFFLVFLKIKNPILENRGFIDSSFKNEKVFDVSQVSPRKLHTK